MINNILIVQKNLKGLKTELKINVDDNIYERILTDERDLRPVFKIGNKYYKVQFKENIFIYSIIVSVPDATNDIGYYSINIYSQKDCFFSNYYEILNLFNEEYQKSNFRTQDIKEKIIEIFRKTKIESIRSFITDYIQVNTKKIICNEDMFSNNKNHIFWLFAFESIYYIPTEIYNSDKAKQLFNSPRFIESNNLEKHFQLFTIENQDNFTNCIFYIDEKRLQDIPTSFNKLCFFLNNNSRLAYNYKSTLDQPKKTISNNHYIIPKYTPPIHEYPKYERRSDNNTAAEVKALNTKLNTYKTISAVLGVLLLITLIGGGYWTNNAINERDEKISELELQIQKETESSTTTETPSNTSPLNNKDTTKLSVSQTPVSNQDSLSKVNEKKKKRQEEERRKRQEEERRKQQEEANNIGTKIMKSVGN
jgi:hypothetical protein